MKPLRFGIAGTGFWASAVHAAVLHSHPDLALTAIYGRNLSAAAELASAHGALPFDDFDAFLDQVDAVTFAVPPNVQAVLAVRAARAGKALLLEKPLAADLAGASALATVIDEAGVDSRLFFTGLFSEPLLEMIALARSLSPRQAAASFHSPAMLPGSPFADSPWRNAAHGPLKDVGPHMLAVLVSILGPVRSVSAVRTGSAAYTCEISHVTGAVSTMSLDLADPKQKRARELYRFDQGDRPLEAGPFTHDRLACFRSAVDCLIGKDGRTDAPNADTRLGVELAAIIDAGCLSLESDGRVIEIGRLTANSPDDDLNPSPAAGVARKKLSVVSQRPASSVIDETS